MFHVTATPSRGAEGELALGLARSPCHPSAHLVLLAGHQQQSLSERGFVNSPIPAGDRRLSEPWQAHLRMTEKPRPWVASLCVSVNTGHSGPHVGEGSRAGRAWVLSHSLKYPGSLSPLTLHFPARAKPSSQIQAAARARRSLLLFPW